MAYSDDIQALNPDHHFKFDGDVIDSVGSVVITNTGCILTDAAICKDAVNCLTTNATGDRAAMATTSDVNQELHRKAVGGWFTPTAIQQPPCIIYSENDTTRGFTMHLGFGNNVMFEVDEASFTLQIYGDIPLENNRAYHLLMIFESSTYGNEFRAFIDGVEQTDSADRIPGGAFTASLDLPTFGSLTGHAIGGTAMTLVSPVNGKYNHWATWSGTDVEALSDLDIRQELFEKGAIAANTITNQAGLDAFADSVRGDAPVCIDIDVAGDITLTADNVTFNEKASVHIRYLGTGTLTWINVNGSNAEIGATTNGGTIIFVNPSVLNIEGLVSGTEVRVYEAGTINQLSGTESETSGTYSDTIDVTAVDIRLILPGWVIIEIENQSMISDVTLLVEQLVDKNYKE